jgi:hypothetical protein
VDGCGGGPGVLHEVLGHAQVTPGLLVEPGGEAVPWAVAGVRDAVGRPFW